MWLLSYASWMEEETPSGRVWRRLDDDDVPADLEEQMRDHGSTVGFVDAKLTLYVEASPTRRDGMLNANVWRLDADGTSSPVAATLLLHRVVW